MPGIEIKGRSKIATYRHGGRISKQLGGVGNTQPITGTQRFDQSRGYYQPDMGMRGGAMYNKGGRAGRQIGGRANLLEEVGRLDAERMNPNRRAEKSRVIGELNRGYNKGGRVGLKKGGDGKWIQKVNKSIKARGTKGKCTPITKPGCTGRAKALAKTFKKMAKKRKAA